MVQYAYPDADTTVNNWAASTGSNRYAMIDDAYGTATAVADNTSISVSDDSGGGGFDPNPEAIVLSLSSVTDPSSASSHSVVVMWFEGSGQDTVTLNVNLKDTDGSDVKNQDFTYDSEGGGNTDPLVSTMSLNAAQANSIANYGNMILTITATDGQMMGTTTTVYQAYFACPDAAAAAAASADPDLPGAAFLMFIDQLGVLLNGYTF